MYQIMKNNMQIIILHIGSPTPLLTFKNHLVLHIVCLDVVGVSDVDILIWSQMLFTHLPTPVLAFCT